MEWLHRQLARREGQAIPSRHLPLGFDASRWLELDPEDLLHHHLYHSKAGEDEEEEDERRRRMILADSEEDSDEEDEDEGDEDEGASASSPEQNAEDEEGDEDNKIGDKDVQAMEIRDETPAVEVEMIATNKEEDTKNKKKKKKDPESQTQSSSSYKICSAPSSSSSSDYSISSESRMWNLRSRVPPRTFQRRAGASGGCEWVRRLSLVTKLKSHGGCVNTVQWNSTGDLLVSGSDDCNVRSEMMMISHILLLVELISLCHCDLCAYKLRCS